MGLDTAAAGRAAPPLTIGAVPVVAARRATPGAAAAPAATLSPQASSDSLLAGAGLLREALLAWLEENSTISEKAAADSDAAADPEPETAASGSRTSGTGSKPAPASKESEEA